MEKYDLGLSFNEETHTYKLNGCIILPSVTQILSIISDEIYSNVDSETLKKASERGTKVHYQTMLYDTEEIEEDDEETKGYIEAYKSFLSDYTITKDRISMVEQPLLNSKMYYAGTIDRLYKFPKNKLVLVDIKTTKKIYTELVSLQLTAYAMAYNSLFGDNKVKNIAVLQLKEDGTYKFEYLEYNPQLFISIWKTYNTKKYLGEMYGK